MKSKFRFKKVSPGWHYDKFSKPNDELQRIDNIDINDMTLNVTDSIISNP